MRCHACNAPVKKELVHPIDVLVASDCQPVHAPMELLACNECNHVQKANTAAWQAACDSIYADYRIYFQSAGREQKARGVQTDSFAPRSELITQFLSSPISTADGSTKVELAQDGGVLDIGCGNGAFLKAFAQQLPGWEINGAEINETFREDILQISERAKFFEAADLEGLDIQFDLVTLIHSLEHIPGPTQYLEHLRRLIKPDGLLLVQVPDATANPFDLIIADHASHFSVQSLARFVSAAGFEACGNLVLGKEITLIARQTSGLGDGKRDQEEYLASNFLQGSMNWLNSIMRQAEELSAKTSFGVFGTSIAASWIASQLGDRLAFFVDEDEDRIGGMHLGRPIYAPESAPTDGTVLIALAPHLADRIKGRLLHLSCNFVIPSGSSE